jgi:catechol 2,3-dioxygenase-like lactoylglutathione lyase family enzyme
MKRVVGLGGVFFKVKDPEKMNAWYEKHLGLPRDPMAGVTFEDGGMTVWSPFKSDSNYFPGPIMLNYRVDDLDALLKVLAEEGVEIDPKRDDHEYGKFAWIKDPEGNRVELWEPPKQK